MHFLITGLTANNAPIWFHEGLAEHDEAGWRSAPRELSAVHQTLLARALEAERLISFERMEPGLVKLETPEDVQLAYAEAASAIEFIIVKAGRSGLRDVMRQMASSSEKGAGDAIQAVLGLTFADFETKWKEYIVSRRFKEVEGVAVRRYKIREGMADDERMELREIKSMVARNRAHLGDLLRERGRIEAAVLEYRRALADAHDAVPILNRLSEALIQLGRFDEALTALQRAVALAPDHPITYANMGSLYLRLKEPKKAREALQNAVQINPFNPDVHRDLATAYEMLGDSEAAKKERVIFQTLSK
jgi:tetratricopeptide (TPR) repeat protein